MVPASALGAALAIAGLWYGGHAVVTGIKKASHAIVKPLHRAKTHEPKQ